MLPSKKVNFEPCISVITYVETHLCFDSNVVVDMIRPIYAQVQTQAKK